ncbi:CONSTITUTIVE EXPRESSER OF PR GENES 1, CONSTITUTIVE EXPRESSER OF PR GENES 30 [Hibiscus trionum]|uniref:CONSTITUTIVE EXPRESSER OF PR GENES 1, CONSTITUTIVE EXPRESSER OF PR GENES 30 n=1 Tax=Hibiscus trionum TaxID=183268 RepID=A0A9W7GTT6_HIBTR|nr:CONSTITUTIVE EXPRESSER OF PR GENES 1, CONSTITUTIVE EXPRESSER OF PR GENES 30 [Hibiscus trionum]
MSDYLPVEVILEILKSLPVKSLVKCRSVCKAWNRLISDPSFISTHLHASLSRPPNKTPFLLLRCLKNGKENYFLHYDNDGFDEFKQLQFPVFGCVSYSVVVGSCNGLICLSFLPHDVLNFVFWNPSIQKYISLPQPSICCDSHDVHLNFGFGFDSRTNDYKLLIVGVEKGDNLIQPYLFSLNENCWKRVVAVSPNYAVEAEISSTFVNGAVHWLGYQRRNNGGFSNTILGFDLSDEEFSEISLPESLISLCPMDLSTMKYGESSIAVLKRDWEDGELLELWVMKEYGVVESWNKVLALHMVDQSGWFPRVLGFRNNGEVLLQVDDGEMASLDLNCQQIEPHGVEVGAGLLSVGSYVESLALLDKAVDVRSVSDVNHAIDSSDSDESSGGESDVT